MDFSNDESPTGPFTGEPGSAPASRRACSRARATCESTHESGATGHEMSDADWVAGRTTCAAGQAHLTGITRLQLLGMDYGPRRPVHFVVEGELHLAFEGVFLHRTKALPPLDDVGVCVEAAFMSYCVQAGSSMRSRWGTGCYMASTWTSASRSAGRRRTLARRRVRGALDPSAPDPDCSSLKESETCALLALPDSRARVQPTARARRTYASSPTCSIASTAWPSSSRAPTPGGPRAVLQRP